MLTIRNIKQIELTFCHSRGLKRVTETISDMGEHFYSFHFGPISDGIGWNKETEVRLKRTMERNDRYEIFVMGLQSVSRHSIVLNDINSKEGLVSEISKTLARAKHWWETQAL
jgi:hypothetical protein